MSSSTKELIALRIYAGKGCFLKESNEEFELVYQNGTTKTVILHEVIEHMNAIEKMTMENEGAKNETKTEDIKAEVKPTPEYSTTLSTTCKFLTCYFVLNINPFFNFIGTVIIFVGGIFALGGIIAIVRAKIPSREQPPLQQPPPPQPLPPRMVPGLRQRFPTSGN